MKDLLDNLDKKDSNKGGQQVGTKEEIINGQKVTIRVFSPSNRKRKASMKTRGKQTNDYSLMVGKSSREIEEIESKSKKKGDILGSL